MVVGLAVFVVILGAGFVFRDRVEEDGVAALRWQHIAAAIVMLLALMDFFVPQYAVAQRPVDFTPTSPGGVIQLTSDCGNGYTVLVEQDAQEPACSDHRTTVLLRAGVAAALAAGLWSWGGRREKPLTCSLPE